MDINAYLAKRYGPQPCFELVADVYHNELDDIPVDYKTVNRSVRQMADAFRIAIHKDPHGFVQVDTPDDFAIVLMGKTAKVGIHHCGIWYAGRILHALSGVTRYEDLPTLSAQYQVIEFWAKEVISA